jgi:cell division protein ZapA (FtsZ GTPase activity inhibitor)
MTTSSLKKYNFSILGEAYTLVSDDPSEDVLQSAQAVDLLLRDISSKYPLVEGKRIAVLAALQLVHRVQVLENSLQSYHRKHSDIIDCLEQKLALL